MQGALNKSEWLVHPCTTRLTLPNNHDSVQRDFQLAVWAAAHTTEPLGGIVAPDSLWIWTGTGGREVAAGSYELEELGELTLSSFPSSVSQIQLDVWCNCLGLVLRETWADLDQLSNRQQEQLRSEIVGFFRAVRWMESVFPAMSAWISSVTKVAIPLYHPVESDDRVFRSVSDPELSGLVQLDVFGGEIQILEALVHESAHRHLFMAEAQGPLIDPACCERYRSPLRPEPRPLRGILMAYHALAHICCFYEEASETGAVATNTIERELTGLLKGMHDAESTLCSNRNHLTESGKDFLDQTMLVAKPWAKQLT